MTVVPGKTAASSHAAFGMPNMGSTRLGVDVPRLVARYREGRLHLDELITARYPLERINEAIAAMEGGEALRNVIVFPITEAA